MRKAGALCGTHGKSHLNASGAGFEACTVRWIGNPQEGEIVYWPGWSEIENRPVAPVRTLVVEPSERRTVTS